MRGSSKSGAFLVEMIIIIAFFAAASAICVRLFVHAHSISTESRNINMAMNSFQTAAECFKLAGGDVDEVLDMLPDCSLADTDLLVVYYDSSWATTGHTENGGFRMEILIGNENSLMVAAIVVWPNSGDAPLYEGKVYSYA